MRLPTALVLIGVVLIPPPTAAAETAGNVTGFTGSGNSYTITAGSAKVRVSFARSDIFRLWLAPTGSFTDPAGTKLAIRTDFGQVATTATDEGTYHRISTNALALRVYKQPMRFELYKADNATPVWRESSGLTWANNQTTQRLTRGADEQFYGTGLRLGEWALRDKSVPIAVDNKWRENNNASPAPFYLSTSGYGVMRNTWAKGQYDFASTVATRHDENRFDAYYFVGGSLKDVLGDYTDVTGKPFLAPIWGLEMGNADCWNASNPDYTGDHNRVRHQNTPDVVGYANDARTADMPSGWFLPNDGYGCSYKDLPKTVADLKAKGFQTGLWTQRSLSDIDWEVGTAGTRAVKTDVAWVGGGYQGAFDGVQSAVDGIERNADARRFVWTVDGWAGTQRNAVVWTGDTYGTWDDMRWHVPAIAGAGFSGFNYAAGDVDGIYSGSPKTFVRDLQWKAFTPALMTMSGWGATNPQSGYNDKQPWRFADPYLSINRKYLKLKMRLTPYFYTLARAAADSGVPTVRAMALEFENDPTARGNATSGQFMAGNAFLVAPVVSDTTTRDRIYLPAGTWTDYWTGKVWTGPGWLDGYDAPLDTLPLFVRGGSIVPMWPQMNHSGEKPATPITYDVYPNGTSSYDLYEDDGLTRAYKNGAAARQKVDVTAPTAGSGDVRVAVGALNGSYTGKLANRGYEFDLHVANAPGSVTLEGTALAKYTTRADYDAAASGWFYDGVLHTKTASRPTSSGFTLVATGVGIHTGTPVAGSPSIPKSAWKATADSEETSGENGAAANAIDDKPATMWHTKWSGTAAPLPHELTIDMGASYSVDSVSYLPRQDSGTNGRIGRYEIYVSADKASWGTAVASGEWADTSGLKRASFAAKTGRYVKLRALSEAGDSGPWTSAAEISATGTAR
ncbi:glycosyl hydrolase family 31 [Actinosynnema sp. ALI-1.44]|uniref:discoidin domain-containing protein n=1 Tax=Actinosynnema sp. ALI-1.44 TaxID=1933779 RepID=UPI00097C00B5|nr:TIM-barrel domain-containing protein [Actinosynnema sp. ALI-1.44]ONI75131.1 glycosyl hydrolase family 31 [Actinosynnema sp. ALI-1.44]